MKLKALKIVSLLFFPLYLQGAIVNLATSGNFAILAGSTITNTGPSLISSNIGVSTGSAVTGFPPGLLQGSATIHSNDAVAQLAKLDLTNAYNSAASQLCDSDLTGQDLGGLTLLPGVYCFNSSAQLTGTLWLNNLNNPSSTFIFQIGSTLTTASASSVQFIGPNSGNFVYWQLGSSALLGSITLFTGNILAIASITMNTGATINCGRALAMTGAVTLDSNTISTCPASESSEVPEPATVALVFAALALFQRMK